MQKPRLGRGLAALLGEAAALPEPTAQSVQMLPVGRLAPGPYQPRLVIDEEGLQNLADSIRGSGILQPILVRPEPDEADAWQIVAGERRWRAARLAGLTEVPCLVRALSDAEALAAGLVENLQRRDLDAIEEAEGYRRLSTEFSLTQDEVAGIVGKSRSHVTNMIRLLSLPPMVQAEIRNGALSAGHARALITHPDPERATLQIIARGLNVRQAEALGRSHGVTRPEKDRDILALERSLAAFLGLKVAIRHGAAGGELRIMYQDLDQLDGLIRLLKR